MNTQIDLSQGSIDLFTSLAKDAGNWSGVPLLDEISPAEKGHLTDLKKKGLLTTTQDEDNRKCFWVTFTDEGVAFAATLGIDLSWIDVYRI